MSRLLQKDNRDKFKVDVKKWCKDNGMDPAKLSRKLEYGGGYIANLFAGTTEPSDIFWHRLEKATGLKEKNYNE